jgi:AcrR family transcriptional regulator
VGRPPRWAGEGRLVTLARISAQARREQFAEAAIRVMSREGLDSATTRRIAAEAGAPHGTFHYVFRDKNELLVEVVAAVTRQVENILRDAIDPARGLAAAIDDGLRGFWRHVISDDGLQLRQYELVIFSRRTAGYEWLAQWQYARHCSAALEVLQRAAEHEATAPGIDLADLAAFLVAAADGLVIQYEVSHDAQHCARQMEQMIRAGTMLAGGTPRPLAPADGRPGGAAP